MSLIYITGPSGSGKSTVRNELVGRGYEAHDTDEDGISAWYNIQTHERVERPDEANRSSDWYEKHNYLMSAERVKALAERGKTNTIFLYGVPANDVDFVEYFDKIL
jgi:guanylate kinase